MLLYVLAIVEPLHYLCEFRFLFKEIEIMFKLEIVSLMIYVE